MAATPSDFSQDRRLLRLETPLGKDLLIAESLEGEEILSGGFSYRIKAFASADDASEVKGEELVGKQVTATIIREDGSDRYINGYVKALRPVGMTDEDKTRRYELTVVSLLWLMGQSTDCRVFQDMTLPEIIAKVGGEWSGYGRISMDTQGSYAKQEIVIQYNETTRNFIQRLARRAGLGYYIEHSKGSHTVTFTDEPKRLPWVQGKTLKLRGSETADHDALLNWSHRRALSSGKLTQRCYNYLSPDQPVEATRPANNSVTALPQAPNLKRYHYSELYDDKGAGKADSDRGIAQHASGHATVQASGNYRHLVAGQRFTVEGEPGKEIFGDDGQTFVLYRLSLDVTNAGDGPRHNCQIEAVPAGELVYPRGELPRIASLQTAVVTGQADDTVYTDHNKRALGRIKAHFHWDRENGLTPDASCWLRVMQTGGGNGFAGFYALPRVGSEVVVAFENGHPDRPFVLGTLPHPNSPPPYGSEPTQSGIKTRSFTPGGASAGKYNELRFDDKDGSEQVYFQAERDYKGLVKRNVTETIKNNETVEVGNDRTIEAGNSITLKVGGNTIVIDTGGITINGKQVSIN